MITWNELENCLAEVNRFTRRAFVAQERLRKDRMGKGEWKDLSICCSAETAAVKRASLDLTMALAKLRKPV